MLWPLLFLITDAVVVGDSDDGDRCCCDGVTTAAALDLAQPKHAKNLTRRRTARKKHINARETHTRQTGRDGNETDSSSQELKP